MNSNNLILVILTIMVIYNIYNEIDKNNKFKNIKQENFEDSSLSPTNLDIVSIKNLSNLATNLISNKGQDLNLDFKNVNFTAEKITVPSFYGMICAFWFDFNSNDDLKIYGAKGWWLCDGRVIKLDNGDNYTTPDLKGRFILGGAPSAPSYANKPKVKGGSDSKTLSINEIPAHNHTWLQADRNTSSNRTWKFPDYRSHGETKYTGETGGGQAFSILPPYNTLAYMVYRPDGVL